MVEAKSSIGYVRSVVVMLQIPMRSTRQCIQFGGLSNTMKN